MCHYLKQGLPEILYHQDLQKKTAGGVFAWIGGVEA